MTRVLLIEDDRELVEMLTGLLREEGYLVEAVTDGQRGLHAVLTKPYEILIIDRMLPGIDGLDLLARLRRKGVATPVLVLTALGTVADRVAGLDSGAEDYLVKPFAVEELLARVRALCRRHHDSVRTLRLGAGELDVLRRVVRLGDGTEVTLAGREFELLRFLADHNGAVFTRAQLRASVFGDAPSTSIVDTYVYYLRRKLGRSAVRTVRGVGYSAGELR